MLALCSSGEDIFNMKLYYTSALGVGRLLQVIRREERSNMMAPWDFGTETLLLYQSLCAHVNLKV